MDRLGYYVEGRYFAGKKYQAIAFAQFRANEFGRNVEVHFHDGEGSIKSIGISSPNNIEEQVA